MRRYFWLWKLRAASGSLSLGVAIAAACSEDGAPMENRPTSVELRQVFRDLCERREECENSWGPADTVEDCAEGNMDSYEDLATPCLTRLVDYFQCGISVENCVAFNQGNGPLECRDLKDVAADACPPGLSF
jgi:hypothetical protein